MSLIARLLPIVVSAAALLTGCAHEPTRTEDPLPTPTQTSPPVGTGPSFDCAGVTAVPKVVCDDPQLAALDRRLATATTTASARPGVDVARLRAEDAAWLTTRNQCWQNADVRRCVVEAYQTRLVELHLDDPATPVPDVVTYRCDGQALPFTAQYYNDFDPQVAVLSLGEVAAITFVEQSGSGARYGRDGVEFVEHQGEVTVDFYGDEFTCRTP